MNQTIKLQELIKEAFEEFCDGDNNGESFLSAQYSDWVIAKLNFSTAEYSKDNCYVSVEGIIERLAVFEENGKFKSVWGDAHEFDEKDIKEDTDEYYLEDVKAYWTFEINIEKNEWCYQEYNITFSEFAATEI